MTVLSGTNSFGLLINVYLSQQGVDIKSVAVKGEKKIYHCLQSVAKAHDLQCFSILVGWK